MTEQLKLMMYSYNFIMKFLYETVPNMWD